MAEIPKFNPEALRPPEAPPFMDVDKIIESGTANEREAAQSLQEARKEARAPKRVQYPAQQLETARIAQAQAQVEAIKAKERAAEPTQIINRAPLRPKSWWSRLVNRE